MTVKNMKIRFVNAVIIFVLFIAPFTQVTSQEPIMPYKTDVPPVLDGKLNDPFWEKAPYVTGFKTFIPDYGIEMVEKTHVYLAYDRENIYFGVRCFDSEPEKIKSSVTYRDNIRPDDWICINLDSFNDQQALYAFYINPAGIQMDSKFASGQEDYSVDLVWYSKGIIDEKGYTIEVKIPFKSIRFTHKEPVEMGIIFERKISRRSEQGTYPPLSPQRGMFFLTQMKPILFHDIKHYTLFEVLPAVTTGQRSEHSGGQLSTLGTERDISLTTKYGITSNLVFDGTYNPDFSQVEADAGQVDVNLRYALFFPEKRPFFLEGSENFNFAGSSFSDPLRSIVHTRMIVNPLFGAKLSGKAGEKNMIATINALDELPSGTNENPWGDKYAHFSIFRYKRAFSDDSYIGALYTGRDMENHYNRVWGTDGQLRLNESSLLGFHGFGSFSREDEEYMREKGYALGLNYVYQVRKFNVSFGIHDISEKFHTETGYITRTGITRVRASFSPKFYPHARIIRRIDPSISTAQAKDKFSSMYETDNSVSIRFTMWRSSSVSVSYSYSTEIFLAQKFKTGDINISGSSQFTKEFYFRLSFRDGKAIRYSADPYQGNSRRASANFRYQPSNKLNTELDITYSDFCRESDSQKKYDYTIIRNKITYQMNRYLFFRGIMEYNNYRKTLLTDFLASFTYIPGTVIHFGYGSFYEKIRWEDTPENRRYVESNRFLETRRGFFFKASYLWRI